MKKNKNVFWQALIITIFIFTFGILLGISFESKRVEKIQEFNFDSHTTLFDFELVLDFVYNSNSTCEILLKKSVFFADKIYEEAKKLEKYDSSNKLIDEAIFLHRRYDFLRTLLWEELLGVKERCGEVNTIVYLYQYQDVPIKQKSIQETMSNNLLDLKNKYGDEIILLPIATDNQLDSLDFLRQRYNLNKIPVIFINEKYKVEELEDLSKIENYLQKN